MIKLRMVIVIFMLFFQIQGYAQGWSGLSAGKLLAISEQGERGFQVAMLYVLGLADGVESQRLMLKGKSCRQIEDITNQDLAKKVLNRMMLLEVPDEFAGKVALNAYLSEFCAEIMHEESMTESLVGW